MDLNIYFDVINDNVNFTNMKLGTFDEDLSGAVSLADVGSATRLISLVSNLFLEKDFNYPSSSTIAPGEYENLRNIILVEMGMSSDYGLTLDDIGNYVKNISKHTLL